MKYLHVVRVQNIQSANSRVLFMISYVGYCRWDLIAGRIPGRKAAEIERFWIMRQGQVSVEGRKEQQALAKDDP